MNRNDYIRGIVKEIWHDLCQKSGSGLNPTTINKQLISEKVRTSVGTLITILTEAICKCDASLNYKGVVTFSGSDEREKLRRVNSLYNSIESILTKEEYEILKCKEQTS